jgi:hypothetical protein
VTVDRVIDVAGQEQNFEVRLQSERKDCHAGVGMLAKYGRCTRPSVGGFF